MDFNTILADFLSSIILVFKRLIFLIFSPYKTLRKVSQEKDYLQVFFIFLLIFVYFFWVDKIRKLVISPYIIFSVFLLNFILTIIFFHFLTKIIAKTSSLSSYIFTFTYSLFPTFIWFVTNALIYTFLPPPRHMTFLGGTFSIVFTAFSLSLLLWKLILTYLSIRFSSKMGFYRIIYFMILYLCLILPYSVILYKLKLFRVPFI